MSENLKISTYGQGPDLVLLHGWAMHSGIWGGLVDVLATEYRVNLVDLPGHGINQHVPLSDDLNEVADLILSVVGDRGEGWPYENDERNVRNPGRLFAIRWRPQ